MMNLTQKVILLTGTTTQTLEIIKGFKAISIVNELNQTIIENVFRHNKNVVYVSSSYNIDLIRQYQPIVINCVLGKTNFKNFQLGSEDIINDFPKMLDCVGIDVGDHISYDSSDNKVVHNNCFICKVAQGNPDKPEHILYESKNFIVLPGLGAFFPGYTMIVPKKHIMSFAELSKNEFEEFQQVLNDMKFILKSTYNGEVFVFECGSGEGGKGKHESSIVHAHVHLAITDMPVLEKVHESGLYPAQIQPEELISSYGKWPYMLYIDQKNNWYITSDPETYFPRQHPRQILADYMGLNKGEYNWRTHPHREKLDSIAEEIYSFLREEFDNLPIWIQQRTKKFL